MADDTPLMEPQDMTRIHLNQPLEVRYWMHALRCSEDDLRALVAEFGPMAAEVREALAKR